MNILVTGANGQLGTELRLLPRKRGYRYIFSDISSRPGEETLFLDITNLEAIRLIAASEKIDVIVNCAAYTDVDKSEGDQAMADLLNHQGAANLARAAAERGAAMIHISTDFVFGGDNVNTPIRESFPPNPLGVYGATKLLGENAVRESGCRSIIIRTAWLYSPWGKNFVKTMMRLTAERDSLMVVSDQIGTPTSAHDLAALIGGIITGGKLDRTGTYHFSNEGACSWYDFACAIRDLAGNTCNIRPCHSNEYPSKARRPAYSVLDKTLVKETFGVEIPHWFASLRDCISRIQDKA